jgi:hypothetical protein
MRKPHPTPDPTSDYGLGLFELHADANCSGTMDTGVAPADAYQKGVQSLIKEVFCGGQAGDAVGTSYAAAMR